MVYEKIYFLIFQTGAQKLVLTSTLLLPSKHLYDNEKKGEDREK